MTFVKNTDYFFDIIKKNNKIRKIINKIIVNSNGMYDGNYEDIKDDKERDDVIEYLNNRGFISIGKSEGYIRYTRGDYYNTKNSKVIKKCDVDLSGYVNDNYDNVIVNIKEILDMTLKSNVNACLCHYEDYYCYKHKICNHNCINIKDYYHETEEDENYNICFFSKDIYNTYVMKYNGYYFKHNKDIYEENTEYYYFNKPFISYLHKKTDDETDDDETDYETDREKETDDDDETVDDKKVIKKMCKKKRERKRLIHTYNINRLFFLNYFKEDYSGSCYKEIHCFLTFDEILDILDYYYFYKDFIEYNNSWEFEEGMSFEEYKKKINNNDDNDDKNDNDDNIIDNDD